MERYIADELTISEIRDIVRESAQGDVLCCYQERIFESGKAALVAEKAVGITLQLLDSDQYVIRQASSRKRSEQSGDKQFTDRQLTVIKALEKVLKHCKKEGVQLIGFSDELVAQPTGLDPLELMSAYALEVDTSDAYKGADSLQGR
ncbi:response regulator [Nitrincola sp. MINF-07-Sa-05]|uniref:response regulator n=1 Tax=Nitrincola salilacus TaxID=3400273 RepID=UPI003917BA7C